MTTRPRLLTVSLAACLALGVVATPVHAGKNCPGPEGVAASSPLADEVAALGDALTQRLDALEGVPGAEARRLEKALARLGTVGADAGAPGAKGKDLARLAAVVRRADGATDDLAVHAALDALTDATAELAAQTRELAALGAALLPDGKTQHVVDTLVSKAGGQLDAAAVATKPATVQKRLGRALLAAGRGAHLADATLVGARATGGKKGPGKKGGSQSGSDPDEFIPDGWDFEDGKVVNESDEDVEVKEVYFFFETPTGPVGGFLTELEPDLFTFTIRDDASFDILERIPGVNAGDREWGTLSFVTDRGLLKFVVRS